MKKLICKSILAAIAVGLVSISYVSADTVDQSVSINRLRHLVIYLLDISFIQHVLIEMMC